MDFRGFAFLALAIGLFLFGCVFSSAGISIEPGDAKTISIDIAQQISSSGFGLKVKEVSNPASFSLNVDELKDRTSVSWVFECSGTICSNEKFVFSQDSVSLRESVSLIGLAACKSGKVTPYTFVVSDSKDGAVSFCKSKFPELNQ